MFIFYLSSGLFLGWSLGANDAANVFGTAVGARMIRFATAALLCAVFVLLGAVISGAGASHTLGQLGSVNAAAGAFTVALAAALAVFLMTKAGYPVSTSQAIVGGIIGWNLFSGYMTDPGTLSKIVMTWFLCPILAAFFGITLYKISVYIISRAKIHMFNLDKYTRWSLVTAGIFGSYALGANNIANVMGVFVPVTPFEGFELGFLQFTPTHILFFLGGVAIGVGVFTYSKKVMMTVGEGISELNPVTAAVVVWAHSLVLFVFSSQSLQNFVHSYNLPALPLVPVSSSQAIVGAILGIALMKKGFFGVRWRTVGGIAGGWVVTPIISCLICLLSLYFLQNVFLQDVYLVTTYTITPAVTEYLSAAGVDRFGIIDLIGRTFESQIALREAIGQYGGSVRYSDLQPIFEAASR